MSVINTVTVEGRIGQDPELKEVAGNRKVVNFSICNTEKYKKGNEVIEHKNWINVVAWDHLATFVERSLKKGNKVVVSGRLRIRDFETAGQKRHVTEIIANEVCSLAAPKEQVEA
jgi:single-strand DNA-binding protein